MAFVSSTFAPYIPPLKDRILAADDRITTVTYLNQGNCNELITQIRYEAASVGAQILYKKFTYSQTGYKFNISLVEWEIVE